VTNVKFWTKRNDVTKHWTILPPWDGTNELARELHIPPLAAQLLYNRGIGDAAAGRRFLQPSLADLIDPEAFTQIDAAVKRIRQALDRQEKIVIYGDYDVDGIVGTAILWRCFQLAGKEVDFYVPHRLDEGYGLNLEALEALAHKKTNLIITVDCGITAHEPARRAAELGIDLIITDHHKPEAQLPSAAAIIHPLLTTADYANPDICGAGVAFKLAWALAQNFSGSKKVSAEFREFLVTTTGLVALGTIADVVPLVGENRVIAAFGLRGLAASENIGLRALIKESGLAGANLESSDIGFRLAPRLNAAGRMGHARLAVELFTKSSELQAYQIARYLEDQNKQRQKVEKEITAEAVEQIKALGMDKNDWRTIVVAAENWHGGVVGIVASRLVDKFNKPAVVLTRSDDKIMGSCRSVPGFDITAALRACSSHLKTFGGHAMAAGLTLTPENIEPFRRALNLYALDVLLEAQLAPQLQIDAEIILPQLDLKTVELLRRLGPFGQGNPPVRLAARHLKLVSPPRRVGKTAEHLQLILAPASEPSPQLTPGAMIKAIAFNFGKQEKKLLAASTLDVAFEPVINHFNGTTTVEMMVEDIFIPE